MFLIAHPFYLLHIKAPTATAAGIAPEQEKLTLSDVQGLEVSQEVGD